MPLKRGKSEQIISENIRQLMKEGYSRTQAVAIAMSYGKSKPKGKKKGGKKGK